MFKVVRRYNLFQDGRKHPSGTELSHVQQRLKFFPVCTGDGGWGERAFPKHVSGIPET